MRRTNLKISEATPETVRHVALNMRTRDYVEFSAVSFLEGREALADNLVERFGNSPEIHVGFTADDEPACVGGTIMTRPNVISLLFFATDRFPEIGLPITRYIRKQLLPRLIEAGVHRIEAVSISNYSETHAWLETIGLSRETGPLYGYGKDGETYLQFAWSSYVRPFGQRE